MVNLARRRKIDDLSALRSAVNSLLNSTESNEINIYLFGPQGGGKSSFILTILLALYDNHLIDNTSSSSSSIQSLKELTESIHSTIDGTCKYRRHEIIPNKLFLHDTRGAREYNSQEFNNYNFILNGNCADGVNVSENSPFYHIFKKHRFSHLSSTKMIKSPNLFLLVIDPTEERLIFKDDDFLKMTTSLINYSSVELNIPYRILCTHHDVMTEKLKKRIIHRVTSEEGILNSSVERYKWNYYLQNRQNHQNIFNNMASLWKAFWDKNSCCQVSHRNVKPEVIIQENAFMTDDNKQHKLNNKTSIDDHLTNYYFNYIHEEDLSIPNEGIVQEVIESDNTLPSITTPTTTTTTTITTSMNNNVDRQKRDVVSMVANIQLPNSDTLFDENIQAIGKRVLYQYGEDEILNIYNHALTNLIEMIKSVVYH